MLSMIGSDNLTADEPRVYTVVYPLDDQPEQKDVDNEHLGPMQLTPTVRFCLFALRGYLLLMCCMLVFRGLQLAGVLHR